jgi:2-succinyl-5-enolpyruvyl-6-hydroxy-3-cyclohexene-1-carboxylate synthase
VSGLGDSNLAHAHALVQGLRSAGVAHAVLSPGSRSTPLALACLRTPSLATHVAVDERCAAFFALGLGRATGLPAVVVATSGSAPAHWYPAVLEADEGRVPLVLISADRPPELVGWGANQTTDQTRLFGHHVRAYHILGPPDAGADPLHGAGVLGERCVEECLWPVPGPVHVNVAFREPLVPGPGVETPAGGEPRPFVRPRLEAPREQVARLADRLSLRRGVILCGPGPLDGEAAEALGELAGALDCPVLADPLSGLRFGPHRRERVLTRYDAFLRSESFAAAQAPDWVLQVGPLPVSKAVLEYLACHPRAERLLLDPNGRWANPLHGSAETVRAEPVGFARTLLGSGLRPAPEGWWATFQGAESRAEAAAAEPLTLPVEARIVRALLERLPAGGVLFCGNSLPVRQVDTWSGGGARLLRVVGNRGVSGIDGQISTTLGLAAGCECPTVGLLGDLAFYHDLNGLVLARGKDVTFVVLNNGGGGIFEYLPQVALPELERGWLTPLGLDYSQAARLFGIGFERVEGPDGFAGAVDRGLNGGGPRLVEVMIDRAESLARHRAYWARVADGG